MRTASKKIAAAIRRTGLSQAECARRIGVRPQHLNRWVRGRGTPRPLTLRGILAALAELSA